MSELFGRVAFMAGARPELFRQPLPGSPRVTPGYSMGLKSVRQPEPGLRRVTPLALATRLLSNSQ